MAEQHLGVPIDKAVISVPAEFDERQRNYTIRAAELAGQAPNTARLFYTLFMQQFISPSHLLVVKKHNQDFLQMSRAFMIKTYQPKQD